MGGDGQSAQGADGPTTSARIDLTAEAKHWASSDALGRIPAGEGRRWVRLAADEHHDAWAIAWPAGTGIDMHDHRGSSAAVVVVAGRLHERYLDGPRRVAARWLEPGAVVELTPDHVHQVTNLDDETALSIHVYSPAVGELDAAPGVPGAVDVAIVGGGASGLLVAAHLGRAAARTGERVVVAIVDDAPGEAVGIAYSTPCDDHLMNVRACALSAFTDEPRHFVEWLCRRHGAIDPSAFVPRRWYGQYLRDVLATLEEHVSVHRVQRRCERIDEVATGATLYLDGGARLAVGHVVLALGHAAPRPIDGPVDVMIEDPWRAGALDRIGADDEVLLVGTGLTAIDVALHLDSIGHRGHVQAVSRRGRVPAVHGEPAAAAVGSLPALDLDRLTGNGACTARALVAGFRAMLADAALVGQDWRTVVDALRPFTASLWRGMDDAERRRFLRHAKPLWDVHRHRMSLAVATRIDAMVAAGKLAFAAGRIRTIRIAPTGEGSRDGAVVEVESRGETRSHRVAWVVNCTGPDADIRRRADPLVRDLLDRGAAGPGWHGMGLDVDVCGRVRRADGSTSETMSAVGPMRVGAEFEATAIPEIRTHAATLARRVTERTSGTTRTSPRSQPAMSSTQHVA